MVKLVYQRSLSGSYTVFIVGLVSYCLDTVLRSGQNLARIQTKVIND